MALSTSALLVTVAWFRVAAPTGGSNTTDLKEIQIQGSSFASVCLSVCSKYVFPCFSRHRVRIVTLHPLPPAGAVGKTAAAHCGHTSLHVRHRKCQNARNALTVTSNTKEWRLLRTHRIRRRKRKRADSCQPDAVVDSPNEPNSKISCTADSPYYSSTFILRVTKQQSKAVCVPIVTETAKAQFFAALPAALL